MKKKICLISIASIFLFIFITFPAFAEKGKTGLFTGDEGKNRANEKGIEEIHG